MVDVAIETYGGLDYAVNNAGIPGETAPSAEQAPGRLRETIEVNLFGVAHAMRAELPALVADDGSMIVNVASILRKVGYPNASAYVAAKHGVWGLTNATAVEYADDDIRVTAVCPRCTDTAMVEEIGVVDGAVHERLAGLHAVDRFGATAEVVAGITL